MNKTYSLIRVSSDKQDFDSQLEAITNYCKHNNIELPSNHIIEEYAVSGYKTDISDRVGLQQILNLAREGRLNQLIVFNADRLGRRTELFTWLTKMSEYNVKILSVTEGEINVTDMVNELMTFIKLWASKNESSKTSLRVRSGKLATAKQGNFNGGRCNLGYKVVNGKLMIDEMIAPIIRETYNIYIMEGNKSACEYLAKFGIKKTQQSLLEMLHNSIYMGIYNHKRDLYSEEDYKELTQINKDLQIVSEEIYLKAKALSSDRRTNYQNAKSRSLNRSDCVYEGLLYHACNGKLTMDYDYRSKKPRLFFVCKRCKQEGNNNYQKTYTSNKLLPILDKAIEKLFIEIDEKKLKKEVLNRKQQHIINQEAKLEVINKQITKNEAQEKKIKENLKKQLTNEIETDTIILETVKEILQETKEETQRLKEERDKLVAFIEQLETEIDKSDKHIEQLLTFKEIYNKVDSKKKRYILNLILDKVVITDYNNIKIVFKEVV